MQEKYLNKLEYNKIIEILKKFSVTYIGKEKVSSLLPLNKKAEVQKSLDETTEAICLIYRNGNIPIYSMPEITVHLKLLENLSSLSIKYLLDILYILKTSRLLKEYIKNTPENSNIILLTRYFDNLYSNIDIENKLNLAILDENNLNDNASSTLSDIRRKIKNIEASIRKSLNSFLSSKYIQEPVITIRNNRFVIPVKQEYKNEIKGFIHDISSSGLTIFVEPLCVFDLNNELNSMHLNEKTEIEKILQNLSNMLSPFTENIKNNINLISILDFIFAKAKYSIAIDGISPIINENKYINLINARHPLIDKNLVVPININIGENFTSLIITGPNTGGKTVFLKTTGLLTLMAMSGLHIPASEKSSIYIFDNIYADIGDEQSILESLSTFSSHLKNIIEITNNATSNSLILIDELGSGTDPIEGASLAISILQFLYNINCLTISTTHYSEIKNFALVTSGFENASSNFDIENLKPTYKFLIGVPGKSYAFDISKKLGLNFSILENALKLSKSSSVNIEDLLKNIYDNKLLIEIEKEKILTESKKIENIKNELNTKVQNIDIEKNTIISNAKIEARNILLDAKDEVAEIISSLKNKDVSNKEINTLRNTITKSINEISLNKQEIKNNISKKDLSIGDNVKIPSINQEGTILSISNNSNDVIVQIGNAKVKFVVNDLILTNVVNKGNTITKSTYPRCAAKNISQEINVIGLNVLEATEILDKYIDTAIMASLPSIRIVHGKGTGTLRKAIHTFLKNHSQVKSYKIAEYGEGDLGVTIVNL